MAAGAAVPVDSAVRLAQADLVAAHRAVLADRAAPPARADLGAGLPAGRVVQGGLRAQHPARHRVVHRAVPGAARLPGRVDLRGPRPAQRRAVLRADLVAVDRARVPREVRAAVVAA